MVLEGGHVPEFGPKKELLAKKGRFYQMANTVRGLHLDERGRGSVSAERFVRHGQRCRVGGATAGHPRLMRLRPRA
tara:strand:+ start:895 stop:1122 length:228 start_codon:yes stop_codon:yes gene_type:complete